MLEIGINFSLVREGHLFTEMHLRVTREPKTIYSTSTQQRVTEATGMYSHAIQTKA